MADTYSPEALINVTAKDDGVAIVEFNRPKKRNALSQGMINRLVDVLSTLDCDANVRAVVLSGSKDGPFSAGADINELVNISTSEAYERGWLKDLTDALISFRKPLIASVTGFALGGGFEIALLCDIIYASEKAVLGLPEVKIGTIPGAGGTQHLARLIGKHRTMEFVLQGATASAADFERWGVVNKTFPADRVLDEAVALASRIASFSSPVLKLAKMAVTNAYENSLANGIDKEKDLYYASFSFEDKKEGMTAFLEKRAPEFKHR